MSSPIAGPPAGDVPAGTVVAVRAEGIDKDFHRGSEVVRALRSVDLEVPTGSLVALHGRSGSGKTTLLNVIGGLERPDRGRLSVLGVDPLELSDDDLAAHRREQVGFVFQNFGLIGVLSAIDNVELVLRSAAIDHATRIERATEALELVALGHRADHLPAELSGGERQRVAVARALAGRAPLLVADEPTGQLDPTTSARVVAAIRDHVDRHAVTAVIATHEPRLVDAADRSIELADGSVVGGRVGARLEP